jgi:hypothetical protein
MILIIEVWERFWYFVLAGQYGAWHPKKDNNLWVFLVGNAEFSSKEKKADADKRKKMWMHILLYQL